MSMFPLKEATTWPDAGIAIAGIGMVSALGTILMWLVFVTLQEHLNRKGNVMPGQTTNDAIAKEEQF